MFVGDSFFNVLYSLLSPCSKPLPHNRRTHDLHLTMKKGEKVRITSPTKNKTVPCGKFSAQLSMSSRIDLLTISRTVCNSMWPCGTWQANMTLLKSFLAQFKPWSSGIGMAEITARTVSIHNYREPMILGCTYTWGRLFKKQEYVNRASQKMMLPLSTIWAFLIAIRVVLYLSFKLMGLALATQHNTITMWYS